MISKLLFESIAGQLETLERATGAAVGSASLLEARVAGGGSKRRCSLRFFWTMLWFFAFTFLVALGFQWWSYKSEALVKHTLSLSGVGKSCPIRDHIVWHAANSGQLACLQQKMNKRVKNVLSNWLNVHEHINLVPYRSPTLLLGDFRSPDFLRLLDTLI